MSDLLLVLTCVTCATLAIAWMPVKKEVVALTAAAAMVALGQWRGFYPADRAFHSISMPVIVILLSIGIFAEAFSESGLFERLCREVAMAVRGRRQPLVLVFLVLTYLLSSFLDNLTCLYVLLPVMIGALQAVGMEPGEMRRTIVAIVIAGNLGGASTMIGDFPNILIARSQSIPFLEFMAWMMPATAVLLGWVAVMSRLKPRAAPLGDLERGLLVSMLRQQSRRMPVDRRTLVPTTVTFLMLVAGLVMTGWWPAPPEVVVLGCACLCVWLLPHPEHWVVRVDVRSILFISCLFVMAGAIESTGALDQAAKLVFQATGGEPYRLSAAIIVLACVLTAVFSAGPTTAALIPAAASLQGSLPGHVVWWCLSLGVLAGSSATLLSATAGPIAANILKARTGTDVTFMDFLRMGWKAALSFVVISIAYIWVRMSL
jgi:Na+/H+ antiporter NhaD/arsenite permease-like protein